MAMVAMAKMEERETGMALLLDTLLQLNPFLNTLGRTEEKMQLKTKMALMVVEVVTEEMAVTQVEAVMVDMEEKFDSLFPKPTLISLCLCSMVPSIFLGE